MTLIKSKNQKSPSWQRAQGGYTLIELVFYVTLFAILSLAVINSLITMTKAFKETAIQIELAQGGDIMEKISREVRKASEINTISANSLLLNTKDDEGADKTVEFLLSDSNVQFIENSIVTGNLNASGVIVTDLAFGQISTTEGSAVKINLTIRSNKDTLNRTINFYNTVVLRGGY